MSSGSCTNGYTVLTRFLILRGYKHSLRTSGRGLLLSVTHYPSLASSLSFTAQYGFLNCGNAKSCSTAHSLHRPKRPEEGILVGNILNRSLKARARANGARRLLKPTSCWMTCSLGMDMSETVRSEEHTS